MLNTFPDIFFSSDSLSLLPSEPKIFYGRDSELSAIIRAFAQQVPRIAILGAGGMGKTSLSRAVLHHQEIDARYGQHRFFVPCDTLSTSIQLAGLIGAHIGLKPGQDLTHPVVHYFASSPSALLILDNLETIWDPKESCRDVEKFLALLAGVSHLGLIVSTYVYILQLGLIFSKITMRGAERPANVRWMRPFLQPLKPLTQDAARQVFNAITNNMHDIKDIDKILLLVDNMPLAIDLIANLVEYEGVNNVLTRWETERISMLSESPDPKSNLELSILLSLSSPRVALSPGARDLLSLLSMLPDGLSDVELVQIDLPLDNILACKSVLLRTALAYTDDQKRLKTLVPIREYMLKKYSPNDYLIQPLFNHFRELLKLYRTFSGTLPSARINERIRSNLSNIRNVLLHGLNSEAPDLVDVIYSSCDLNHYGLRTGHGTMSVMQQIPHCFPKPCEHRLELHFITEVLSGHAYHTTEDQLISQALGHLDHVDDPDLKCEFTRS
jgi:Cdc6-like AAA superfamily ATPase